MRRLGWLVYKDLMRFFSDRRGAALTVLMPVILAALLGMLFSPPDLANTVELALIDHDGSEGSRRLRVAIQADPNLEIVDVDEAEARSRVSRGRLPLALILPKGTGLALQPASLVGGSGITAILLHDPSRRTEAELVEGLVTRIVFEQTFAAMGDPAQLRQLLGRARLLVGLRPAGPERDAWVDVLDRSVSAADKGSTPSAGGAGLSPPLAFEREEALVDGPVGGYNSYAHTFAGMLCMFLLFWAADAAKELIAEREQGLQTRLRLCALTRLQILGARVLSTALVALLISVTVYAAGFALFGIEVLGGWLPFLAVLLAQALFAGAFSVFLAGVGGSERGVANLGTFAILVMSFLGGAWLPTFLMPEWLRSLALGLPTFWATDGLAAATWRGLPPSASLTAALILLGFGAVSGAIGARAFRWQ